MLEPSMGTSSRALCSGRLLSVSAKEETASIRLSLASSVHGYTTLGVGGGWVGRAVGGYAPLKKVKLERCIVQRQRYSPDVACTYSARNINLTPVSAKEETASVRLNLASSVHGYTTRGGGGGRGGGGYASLKKVTFERSKVQRQILLLLGGCNNNNYYYCYCCYSCCYYYYLM